MSTIALIERIYTNRGVHNLSSAIRYFKNVRQSADIPERKESAKGQ